MHDTPRLVPPRSSVTATLVPGQCYSIYLRCGTAIVAFEGDVLATYRDHSLAWLDDAIAKRKFALREGEQHTFDQRGVTFISTARGPAARCAIQPTEPGPAAALAHRWLARFAGWMRLPRRRNA